MSCRIAGSATSSLPGAAGAANFEQIRRLLAWHHHCTMGCMLIKVYDGTKSNGGRSLCETCRNATITRGAKLEDEIVRCEAQPMTTPVLIRFKVTECSAYVDARLPTYAQLLEQAWILKPTSGRRQAGFVRSSDLRDDEFRQLLSELHHSE